MRYYHDQHIGVYENAISDEWCDKIINYFEENINKAEARNEDGGSLVGIRDTQLYLNNILLKEDFSTYLNKIIPLYTYKYPHILNPLYISGYKIQKTLPTEGFHPYHIEQGTDEFTIRRVGVYTLYLNDVREGGETEFLYQLKKIKPKKGTICIFPAGYTHVHRGNTPFSGEKYIMTGWLELPKKESIGS